MNAAQRLSACWAVPYAVVVRRAALAELAEAFTNARRKDRDMGGLTVRFGRVEVAGSRAVLSGGRGLR